VERKDENLLVRLINYVILPGLLKDQDEHSDTSLSCLPLEHISTLSPADLDTALGRETVLLVSCCVVQHGGVWVGTKL